MILVVMLFDNNKEKVYILEGVLRFIINMRLQYVFRYVRRNRSVKIIDWHGDQSIVLI